MMEEDSDLNLLILYYFLMGVSYNEIVAFITYEYDFNISLSTLKRRLKSMNLFRKKYFSTLESVIDFIEGQLSLSGQLHGYRWMHLRCIHEGFTVSRKIVRLILKELDPVGVEFRSRRRLRRRLYSVPGPNFMWHLDSYDKLKPYGISINGAIDGFSRRIIWLKASRTSNDPKVIGGHYIKAVETLGGCPRQVRADFGTENVYIEQFQRFFRETPGDTNSHSFLYGTSQANQRIECWWSTLRKHCTQFWMNLFQKLKEDGHYAGTVLDKALMQFCFLKIIQEELDQVQTEWNYHRIRRSRNAISPPGRPEVMFTLPELYNTRDYLIHVPGYYLNVCKEECLYFSIPCDTDIYELCRIILSEQNLIPTDDPYNAIDLYIHLRNTVTSYLQME